MKSKRSKKNSSENIISTRKVWKSFSEKSTGNLIPESRNNETIEWKKEIPGRRNSVCEGLGQWDGVEDGSQKK